MLIDLISSNFNFILIIVILLIALVHFLTKMTTSEDLKDRIQKVKTFGKLSKSQENRIISVNDTLKSQKISDADFILSLRSRLQKTIDGYKLRLEQAGWSSENGFLIYIISNVSGFAIGTSLYFFLIFSIPQVYAQIWLTKLVIFMLFLFICIRFFEYILDYTIARRYAKIKKHLTFVVDLLGVCVRAGLTIDGALEKIAEEIATINPDLCKELTQTSIELDLIPDRHIAFRNFARRIDIPLIHILVSSIIQAEEQGASISNTLNVLSQEFTKHKILEIEAKAARLPVLLALPLALFSFPCLLIILLAPAIVNITRSAIFH
jgi:tight adherence protein C